MWKSTYRLVIPQGDGAPFLQGWAIVDNTLGEDWDDVKLSLVAGAPQSFVQPLSQPIFTRRPVVPLSTSALFTPQTHDATLTEGKANIAGAIRDTGGGALPGVQVSVEMGVQVASAVTDSNGRFAFPGLRSGRLVLHAVLQGFRSIKESMELRPGDERTLNLTMDVGGLTESVTVSSEPADRKTMRAARRDFAREAGGAPPAPAPIAPGGRDRRVGKESGRSHGRGPGRPVRVLARSARHDPPQSVGARAHPAVDGDDRAGVDSGTPRPHASRPLRAVWLTNDTGSTLDGGSIALMEGNTFAGEGLLDPIKPGERRLISFAADLAGRVSATRQRRVPPGQACPCRQGVMVQSVEDRSTTTYTARNEDASPRTFVIEHPLRSGWTLAAGGPPPAESTAALHRFRLVVPPSSSGTLKVDEVHPVEASLAVTSITTDHVAVVLRGRNVDVSAEPQLRAIIAQTQEVARLEAAIDQREGEVERIEKDQERVRENLEALKSSPEERTLTARYARQLTMQEDRLEVLGREIEAQEAALALAEKELERLANAVTFDVEMP